MNADEVVRQLRGVQQKHANDKLLTSQTDISAMARDCANMIESLQAQLAASQRRADAAVGDIKDAATTTEKVCKWCLHRGNRERCQSCGWATGWLIRDWKSDNWEWRGPQAGKGARGND